MRGGGYPSNFLYYLQMSCSGNGRASRILSEYKRILIQKYLQNSDSEIFVEGSLRFSSDNTEGCGGKDEPI